MFCQKCSLHYPDHLSFCRRCGQTLVHSNAETVIESHCCTQCGARVVRGENFCQHCGNRASVTLQETVIGACYHCGTSWRSGWIFCKNCGLDRKRALLLSTSTSSSGSLNLDVSSQIEEFPEIAKVNCPSCKAEAKPYSRFCEVCGSSITGNAANKAEAAEVEPVPASAPVQNSPKSQSLKYNYEPSHRTSATIFEPRSLSESDRKQAEDLKKSESLKIGSENLASGALTASGNLIVEDDSTSAFKGGLPDQPLTVTGSPVMAAVEVENGNTQAKTVVTPLPPFGGEFRSKDTGSITGTPPRNRQQVVQSLVLIALAFLLIFLAYWWFNRDSQSAISSEQSPAKQQGNNSNKAGSEGMAYIPGGKFEMGLNDGDEYETPAHTVTVRPFFIDRTEVTNEQYQQFVSETGHRAPSHWRGGKFLPAEAKMPVINVSWDDAEDYAKWTGKRLPTETEWEFAARGPDSKLYPWGNNWNAANANAGREANGAITKVGSFPGGASPFGVMDMCGNVWEWTSSSLVSYADENKEIAPGKVIRGGAYDTPGKRATATYRGVLPPDRLRDKTGFRLARDAQ